MIVSVALVVLLFFMFRFSWLSATWVCLCLVCLFCVGCLCIVNSDV